jgi:tetratricopeptide (TPR) repeat protein
MGSDLEIEIRAGSTPGTYDVEVDSPAGTATGTMQLDAKAILDRRRELASSVLASAVTPRSNFPTLEQPVREVGNGLFAALFTGHVYGRYTASLQQASSLGQPLRVVLRLRADELAGIPWETMFDPESGEYLCQREPVVRYVEAALPSAPLTATGPLRILGMVAAPKDLPALDTAEERRRLDDALGELCEQGLVEMVWVEGGHWGALQQKLVTGPWHVLHVISHGGVRGKGGVLALEDEKTGNSAMVGAARFSRLLHACRPVPRLVVLNSCSSGESAADDLLSSTAAALVHSGITATVAMQFAVTDPAALAFSRGFYQALSRSIAVDEAVRLGRIAIDGTSEQTLEWVTPVVYLRTDDTRLFNLTSQKPPPTPPEQEEISSDAAKYGLYLQAKAAARTERYDEALALLDSLVTLDATFRDAAELRDGLRRDQRVRSTYAEALAAEKAGDHEAALRGFSAVVDLDSGHLEAQKRRAALEQQVSILSLQDELRVHAADEEWEAVVAVSDELAVLDPAAADPDGLATRARAVLAPQPDAGGDGGGTGGPVTTRGTGGEQVVVPQPPQPPQPHPQPHPDPQPHPQPHPDPQPTFPWKWVAGIGAPLVALAGVAWWLLSGPDDVVGPGGGGQDTGTVTCWDGSSADGTSNCPLPVGAEGLATVFPSMQGSNCEQKDPTAPGKEELYECSGDGFVIRYSRWDADKDRFAFFDSNLDNAESRAWNLNGAEVGREWIGLDDRENETRRFRWVASYTDAPYDVTVKGVDDTSMSAGIQTVQAKQPEQIGLP